MLLLALIALFTLSVTSNYRCRWSEEVPLASAVTSMTAQVYNSPNELPDIPVFTVPEDHVQPILDALLPARRDRSPIPKAWQVLGELKIERKDGKPTEVHLFWTAAAEGAFAVGQWGRQEYFRGGTDRGIEQAIRAAYLDLINRSQHEAPAAP
jgi:hypothetical protein